MPVRVKQLGGALGAEIEDVDLSAPLSDAEFSQIRQAFYRYQVVFFRDQRLTPEEHIEFAERWGRININRFFGAVPGYPMIAEIRKEPEQRQNIGQCWHTDHSYDAEPAFTSILYAKVVPDHGGATLFASMIAAYDALPDGLKKMLAGLRAKHSSRHAFGDGTQTLETRRDGRISHPERAVQDAVHPVVVIHPANGRRALYVNPDFTVSFEGWTQEESKSLLEYLYRHASQPCFTCHLSWAEGTLAMWDNRATWHRAANDYNGQRRLMHRITVEGEPLSR